MTQQHYTAIADTKREQRQCELTHINHVMEVSKRLEQHQGQCPVCAKAKLVSEQDPQLCPVGRDLLMDMFT